MHEFYHVERGSFAVGFMVMHMLAFCCCHMLAHPDCIPNSHRPIQVGFRVTAEMGARYTDALKANEMIIARNVTGNLLERPIKQKFA
jgi:hypothetical protein